MYTRSCDTSTVRILAQRNLEIMRRSEGKSRTLPSNKLQVEYIAQNFCGKGELLDLSEEGLKMQAAHAIHTGLRLALQIKTTDSTTPLHIARAHVRWVKGAEIGVKFDSLDSTVKTQLTTLLAALSIPVDKPT